MASRAFSTEGRSSTIVSLRKTLVIALIGVGLGLTPFVSGLVGALILATIARPVYVRVARMCPRRVAAFGVAFGALIVLLLPGAWVASTVIDEATSLLRDWNPESTIAWLSRTPVGKFDIAREVANVETAALGWISGRATIVVGTAMHTVINVVIALFGLYYLLLEGPTLWRRIKRLLPASGSIADLLASRFEEVTEALVLGTALSVALQGLLVGIAFALLGLRPAALWGFITACAAVVPGFGSALVWGPAAVVLFAHGEPIAATVLACYGILIVSNVDNLVRLVVFRHVSGIHPMLTLVGAFAGVRLFGIIGAFLGPLALSYLVELIGAYEDASRIVGGIPESSA